MFTRQGMGRTLLWFHLFLSPLMFYRATTEAFEFNKVLLLLATAGAFAALALSAVVQRVTEPPGRWLLSGKVFAKLAGDPISAGVCLYLVSAALSTIFSVSPLTSWRGAHESYAGLATTLAYGVLFFATRALCSSHASGRCLLTASLAAAGLTSLYAIAQVARLDPVTWENASVYGGFVRPLGTLGHANFLAGFLVMALPVAASFAWSSGRNGRWAGCCLVTAAAGLSVLVVVLCLSRGAWAALAAMVVVPFLGLRGWSRRRTIALAVVVILLAVPAVLLANRLIDGSSGSPGSLASRFAHFVEAGGRRHIWAAGLRLFRDRPILGWGVDTFPLVVTRYRTPAYWQLEWNCTPARAHNEWIQVLATQGLLGAAAVLLITWGIARSGIRAWSQAEPRDRPVVPAVLAGAVGFYVQNLFSFTVAACGTLFITYAALLSRWGSAAPLIRDPDPRAPRSRSMRVMSVAIATAIFVFVIRSLWLVARADIACAAGQEQLASKPAAAVEHIGRATRLDPDNPYCWSLLSMALATAVNETADASEQVCLLRRARESLERAVTLVPVSAENQGNLARLVGELALRKQVAPSDALDHFDLALRLDPANPLLLADAGRLALRLQNWDRARGYAQVCHRLYPDFGPPACQLAFLALQERRWSEARAILVDAQAADWKNDTAGRELAHALLLRMDSVTHR